MKITVSEILKLWETNEMTSQSGKAGTHLDTRYGQMKMYNEEQTCPKCGHKFKTLKYK